LPALVAPFAPFLAAADVVAVAAEAFVVVPTAALAPAATFALRVWTGEALVVTLTPRSSARGV